jgi:putative peptidoglycan lipid II flippase
MAAGTMTSRLLGVLRASLLAGVIGVAGPIPDAFQTANTLPNQFYLLLAGGILNAVLVPQIIRATASPDGGEDFLNRLVTAALVLVGAATVVATAAAPLLVRLYYHVDDPRDIALATTFAVICLPQIFFYGLYTLFGQFLNAHSRFAAYMWAPVLANVVAIAGLLWFRAASYPLQAAAPRWTPAMIGILAGTATLSIAVQAVALIPPLRRTGFRYRPRWGFRGFGFGPALDVARWTLAAVLVSQLGFVVTSWVMTRAGDLGHQRGLVVPSRATFDNAFLIFMLPHSLVTVSLVTALFTRMARAARARDHAALVADLGRGLRMPAVLLVPAVAVAIAFAPTITATLFFGNAPAQTQAVAVLLPALLLGVIPFGWFYLSERFFYAHEDARTPFRVQLVVTSVATVVTVVASTVDPRQTGVVVGSGQSAAYLCGAAFGFSLIRRRVGRLGLRRIAGTYLRLAVPAVAWAVVLAVLAHRALPDPSTDRLLGLGVLAVAGVVEVVGTLGVAHLLGVTEVRDLLDPVLRRVRRP